MFSPPIFTLPHPVLTAIHGPPNCRSIQVLKRELYTNARAVPSSLGGGAHGHLGAIMTALDYTLHAPLQPWVNPHHPGPQPAHPANASNALIAATNRAYDDTVHNFRTWHTFLQECNRLIIAAIEPIYLSELYDADVGFADVKPLDFLEHLQLSYGEVTEQDLADNLKLLLTPWHPQEQLETIWARIAQVQKFAAAHNEDITDNIAIRSTLSVFETADCFPKYCDKWHATDRAMRTMAAFKELFKTAMKEYERHNPPTTTYPGAALSTTTRSPVSATHPSNTRPPGSTATAPTTTSSTASSLTTCPTVTVDGTPLYYCWSHGLGRNPAHTSPTCEHKLEGHRDDATFANRQGGSTRIMVPRNNNRLRNPRT